MSLMGQGRTPGSSPGAFSYLRSEVAASPVVPGREGEGVLESLRVYLRIWFGRTSLATMRTVTLHLWGVGCKAFLG